MRGRAKWLTLILEGADYETVLDSPRGSLLQRQLKPVPGTT